MRLKKFCFRVINNKQLSIVVAVAAVNIVAVVIVVVIHFLFAVHA